MEEIITRKMVIETVGKELEKLLSPYGFKFIKSKNHLIRKYRGGHDRILFFTITGYPFSHQNLGVQFMVRNDEVELILEPFFDNRFRNMEYAKTWDTVFANYIDLKKESDSTFERDLSFKCELCQPDDIENEFCLHTKEDISNAVIFLEDFIKRRAFPYFDKNREKDYLNKWFQDWMLKSEYPLDVKSIMNSLVLMKLCDDKNYDSMMKKYLSSFKAQSGFEIESHNALNEIISHLDKNF